MLTEAQVTMTLLRTNQVRRTDGLWLVPDTADDDDPREVIVKAGDLKRLRILARESELGRPRAVVRGTGS